MPPKSARKRPRRPKGVPRVLRNFVRHELERCLRDVEEAGESAFAYEEFTESVGGTACRKRAPPDLVFRGWEPVVAVFVPGVTTLCKHNGEEDQICISAARKRKSGTRGASAATGADAGIRFSLSSNTCYDDARSGDLLVRFANQEKGTVAASGPCFDLHCYMLKSRPGCLVLRVNRASRIDALLCERERNIDVSGAAIGLPDGVCNWLAAIAGPRPPAPLADPAPEPCGQAVPKKRPPPAEMRVEGEEEPCRVVARHGKSSTSAPAATASGPAPSALTGVPSYATMARDTTDSVEPGTAVPLLAAPPVPATYLCGRHVASPPSGKRSGRAPPARSGHAGAAGPDRPHLASMFRLGSPAARGQLMATQCSAAGPDPTSMIDFQRHPLPADGPEAEQAPEAVLPPAFQEHFAPTLESLLAHAGEGSQHGASPTDQLRDDAPTPPALGGGPCVRGLPSNGLFDPDLPALEEGDPLMGACPDMAAAPLAWETGLG